MKYKSHMSILRKYVKDIPEKIKKEVSIHTSEFVTASAIKNVTNI